MRSTMCDQRCGNRSIWYTPVITAYILMISSLVVVVVTDAGCGGGGDEGRGPTVNRTARLELAPEPSAGQFTVGLAEVAPGEATWVDVEVFDSGEAPLTLSAFDWRYDAPEGESEGAPAFSCAWGPDGRPCGDGTGLPVVLGVLHAATGLPERVSVRVRFVRPEDDGPRAASLTIRNDGRDGDRTVRFATDTAASRVQVTPDHLRFKGLRRGEVGERTATVLNGGSADLIVDRLTLTGDADFVVRLAGQEWTATEATRSGVDLSPPLVLAPGRSALVVVAYEAEDRDGATGTLSLRTNDALAGWVAVRLEAVETGPVLDVNPARIEFGPRVVTRDAALPLQLLSRGTEPVTVTAASFDTASSPDFAVTQEDGTPFADALPLVLAPNDRVEVLVRYLPDAENDVDELSGQPVLDLGTLVVESDGFDPRIDVPVSGWGVGGDCPTAVIRCEEGDEVVPQTTLHLDGSESVATVGRIVAWAWSVEQPGAGDIFLPGGTAAAPSFEANAAGTYTFSLDVWDESGRKSCQPAVYEVVVRPTNAIHVELLWTTPGDPDESDTGSWAGADLDLHFLHPNAPSDPDAPDVDGDGAPDPWFDTPYDTYFFNPRPDWGAFGYRPDDPRLDRDDTDGAGPENLNLDEPESGVRYTVAVHYWNDHGYGVSFATVRFYLYGIPVEFAETDVRLVNGDLWCVAHVDWPSGAITPCRTPEGARWIVPDYRHPMFFGE